VIITIIIGFSLFHPYIKANNLPDIHEGNDINLKFYSNLMRTRSVGYPDNQRKKKIPINAQIVYTFSLGGGIYIFHKILFDIELH